MKTSTKLMTTGSISKNIITFAFPIFLGNLFQQLYMLVDTIVLGKYVGSEALAAITSCSPLIFLLVGLFSGIFIGVGVVISKFFGAKNLENVKKAVHTTVAFAILSSIFLTLFGYFFAPKILLLMKTPASVLDDATTYIQIYFLGISSLIMFNSASGILQAMGDSKRPLYFLIISSITNIILDLVFVIYFNLRTEGVALATIISQGISALLAYRILFTTKDIFRVYIKQIKLDIPLLKQFLIIGIPSGIQNSVISIANVFVQSSINIFGPIAMAGNGAMMRIQGFAFIPVTSFALAMTTYTSQNIGAGEFDRVKKGTKFGLISAIILAQSIGLIIYFFSPSLLKIFTSDPAVIEIGILKAKITAFFFIQLAISHTMAGIYRGAGKSIIPMAVMLLFWCLFRVTYITIALKFFYDIRIVFSAYPVTWNLSAIVFIIYYFKGKWLNNTQLKNL
ncbi:MAG: MATE family efflux transporter [Spirochaetia bacterium]|nr:MATE family efflux transporter [Spirochaetia bacterium]